ncbi:MAG: HEAT repeat domain-containing protein [bacterium]
MASAPAFGQVRAEYRTANPRALVQAWKTVPREERDELAAAIVVRRAEMLPALWDAARFGDTPDKLFACGMIAEMRDHDGVDAVVAASADPDVRVRRRAATALRILADPGAAPRLRELVRTEPDLGVLKTALAGLGRLGQKRDVHLIAPFIGHSDEGVRVVAAGSLAMLGDERALALVLQATTSADPGVQKSATYALGFFQAAAAGDRLQAILADPQGAWKSYALIAQAERALAGKSAAAQVAALDGLANGRSRTLAEWSVDRLTDIGSPDAADVLRKVRNRQTPVAQLAARRLLLIGAQP